jgi:hexokinase
LETHVIFANAYLDFDRTGTLMARAYQSGSALVGAIFGTGTNAAYVERLSAVKKLSGHQSPTFGKAEKMIINTEWGAFDNSVGLFFLYPFCCSSL